MKRPLILKLFLLLVVYFTAYQVMAQGEFIYNNIKYAFDSNKTTTVSVINNNNSGQIIIPDKVYNNGKPYNVTSIANSAFSNCVDLTSVVIPYSVTSVGDYAFRACKSLTSITIPNSVTSIGDYAFYDCSTLSSITISNQLTIIGYSVFGNCLGLTSITIPNSVKTIGANAFYSCAGLSSVTIPSSVTSILKYAFFSCNALTSITIPNSITKIEEGVFASCSSLSSVSIPNSVNSISHAAFGYCSNLTSITIPASVTLLETYTFGGCTSLITIESLNPEPPTSFGNTFFQVTDACNIKVPIGSAAKYKNATGWSQFKNFQETFPSSVKNTEYNSVKVTAETGHIVIKGAPYGKTINIYTVLGVLIKSIRTADSISKIKLPANQIYLVQIGETSHKVVL